MKELQNEYKQDFESFNLRSDDFGAKEARKALLKNAVNFKNIDELRARYDIEDTLIDYDSKTDTVYVKFGETPYEHSFELSNDIILDLDTKGVPIALEILNASKYLKNQMTYIDKKYYDKFPKKNLDELEKEITERIDELLKEYEETIKECFKDHLNNELEYLEEDEWTNVESIESYVFNY